MKKKIVSIALAAAVLCASLLTLAGCGDGDYPVNVANITIDKAPQNIVVLDPSTADIISYIGYDRLMVGRSEEVDQEFLSVAPEMGSLAYPNVQSIVDSGTEVVFAGEDLDAGIEAQLIDKGVTVIKMSLAQTPKQLETNYRTIGRVLGGEITGDNKGSEAYSKLIDSMERLKSDANAANSSNVLDTVCYLYCEDGVLKHVTSGTYGDMLLGYTGAVNVAVNIDDNTVDVNTLKVANPNYIFYADEVTLNAIKSDSSLSKLAAVTSGKLLEISSAEISRQGITALETLQKMIDFIHPKADATADEAQKPAAQTTTEPASEDAKSVAGEYGIELKELSLKYEDENDDVKAMQQRLFDLGYVDDDENITGYYGDISKQAVKNFQKKNGIKDTGTADNATLVAMFLDNAKKADE